MGKKHHSSKHEYIGFFMSEKEQQLLSLSSQE
jgi:hypothetical protein